MGSETIPSTCYILPEEPFTFTFTFYSSSNGYENEENLISWAVKQLYKGKFGKKN